MSAVFQQQQIKNRAAKLRKGEQVGERPRGGPVGEFNALRSCLRKDDGTPEPDLNALAMGIRQDLTPRRPVIKADHEHYVSSAIALDGMTARERIYRAEAIAEGRSDADATAHEHGKPPAPPKPEVVDTATLAAQLAKVLLNAIQSAAAVPNTSQTSVAKSEQRRQPSEAEVQEAIADSIVFLKRTVREPRQRVTLVKSENGGEVPVILRVHRAA